ncbi:MAG: thiamine pyrophosphate-dependent enzyme [Rhodocyclaceae bacterium]
MCASFSTTTLPGSIPSCVVALGWGMPAAIGFLAGIGRQPVVSLVGDGAAMYSPQALWTAVNEKLPVTFVVINNREYNILKNFMRGQSHYNLGAHRLCSSPWISMIHPSTSGACRVDGHAIDADRKGG